MKKITGLFGIYICIHSFTANPCKKEMDDSDRSVIINQREFEEDQNVTISSFETKLQLKAEAFYEELLNDQPIATQLQILITDLIFCKDLLKKTNNHYDYLLLYEAIIHLLKNRLSFSETALRNLSINDAPSISSIKVRSKLTKHEFMEIYHKTLKNKKDLRKILFDNIKNNKYQKILNKTPIDRFNLIKEIPENQELQIEKENIKKLLILRNQVIKGTLEDCQIELYKLLKNLESNKKRRKIFQNTSEEAKLLNKAQIRLLQKMKNPELQEAPKKSPSTETNFFTPFNNKTTLTQATKNLHQLINKAPQTKQNSSFYNEKTLTILQ